MKKFFVLLLCILTISLIVSCSPTIKTKDGSISFKDGKLEVSDKESGQTMTVGEDGMEITDEDGDTILKTDGENMELQNDEDNGSMQVNLNGGLQIPDGYPVDILPLIEEYSISLAYKGEGESSSGGDLYQIDYRADVDIEKVHDFYKAILEDSEYFIDMDLSPSYSMGGSIDKYSLTVLLSPSNAKEGATTVQLHVEEVLD